MLSRHDRRRLDGTEHRPEAGDPESAYLVTDGRGRSRIRWSAVGPVLTIAVATLAMLLGLTVLDPVLVPLAVLLAAIGWIWLLWSRRAQRT